MKAGFLGRFQPFHVGHKRVVEEYREEFDEFEILVRQYPDVFEYTRKARQYLEQHGRHLASDDRRHVQDGWVQLPPIELEWEATN